MPSRRSPVTMARAMGSKSSTTSTLMTGHVPFRDADLARFRMPGRRSQPGISRWHRAETGAGVEPLRSDPEIRLEIGHGMSDATIEVAGLRKRFGSTLALDGMTFTVSPGQVTGFVGPNGAGKSTTMRVILGLDAPDAGTRADRRPALPEPAAPADPGRRAARRGRAAAGPDRPQPPAVAGPLPGPGPRRVDEVIEQAAWSRRPGGRRAATRWACGSGSGSPPRCSATRRC